MNGPLEGKIALVSGAARGQGRSDAIALADAGVNCVHPTGVRTDLLINESTFRLFRPDPHEPTIDDVMSSYYGLNLLPVPWVEPVDVSNVVVFRASHGGRYITGSSIPVDAGMSLK